MTLGLIPTMGHVQLAALQLKIVQRGNVLKERRWKSVRREKVCNHNVLCHHRQLTAIDVYRTKLSGSGANGGRTCRWERSAHQLKAFRTVYNAVLGCNCVGDHSSLVNIPTQSPKERKINATKGE